MLSTGDSASGIGDKDSASDKTEKDSGSGRLGDSRKDGGYSASEVNAYRGGILKAKSDPSKKYTHSINPIAFYLNTEANFVSSVSLTIRAGYTKSNILWQK